MPTELIEIDPVLLGQLLEKKNLCRQDFALILGISTKTIQRWMNGSVRRVHPKTLERIAQALDTTSDQLRKSSVPIEIRPINRALEEICRESFLERIRVADEYKSHLKLLKTFNPQELCTSQRMILYQHIGLTSFVLGKIRASRMYLDEALKIATALNDPGKIVSILTWAALREDSYGNNTEAFAMISQAEQYLPYLQDLPQTRGELLFRKGYILYHLDRVNEAIPLIKESILIEHKQPNLNLFHLSIRYFHLSECYLKQRNFAKARSTLIKTCNVSERAGWVRGQSYCHFSLGIIHIFQKNDCQSIRASFNKGRVLRGYAPAERIIVKPEQREFIYLALKGQLTEARNLIANSIRLNRRYVHFFAYSVLDGLFFAKFSPETFYLRPSLVERATDYFKKNNLQLALGVLFLLQEKDRISLAELLELYIF